MSKVRTPRPYQRDAIDSIFETCREKDINPIVALPVGTGKEFCMSVFIKEVLFKAPRTRILSVTHVRELISQNYSGLLNYWNTAPAGIYSAGLGKKEIAQITFAGVASIANKTEVLGKVDIIIVDECQLIGTNSETMYLKLINNLKEVNPNLRVIGFTGTAFRLGHGLLYEDHPIFNKLCFDMCDFDGYNYFFDNHYLAKIVSKKTVTQLDISGVKKSAGDYNQHDLQAAVDKIEVTREALKEVVAYGHDRKHWLIFASGCEHSDHIAEMLNDEFGIPTVSIHSKMSNDERDVKIADFKSGKVRCAVNNLVLTTGFNFTGIDLIADIAPTTSPVRYIQKIGRISRPVYADGFDLSTLEGRRDAIAAGSKPNGGLYLDFANNVNFHGAVNDVRPPKKKGEGGGGEAPSKTCYRFLCGCSSEHKSKCDIHDIRDMCNTIHHPSARFCVECGGEFIFEVKITNKASDAEVVATKKRSNDPKPPKPPKPDIPDQWIDVQHVEYKRQNTKSGDMLKVTYNPSLLGATEFVGFDHPDGSWQRGASFSWWNKRISGKCPRSIDEVLKYVDQLPKPARILVSQKGKFLNVKKVEFGDDFVISRLVEKEREFDEGEVIYASEYDDIPF
jgi:DNA repair protein RadD